MSWRVFGLAWALLFVLAVSFALATPISAAPDEPAHLVKAASVVRGQLVGEYSDAGQVVQVPRYIATARERTCFAFQPTTSASCTSTSGGPQSDIVDGSTSAGLYNPLYYAVIGWPSLIAQDAGGIYAMRLAGAAACSLFLALAAAMIARWPRPGIAPLGLLVSITPMVLFLSGTVNPNSLEIASILAVFVGMLSIALHPQPDLLASRAAIVMSSAAIAVNTRGLAPVWLVVAIATPLILVTARQAGELLRSRIVWLAVAVVAAATGLSVLWLSLSGSLTAGIEDPRDASDPSVGESAATGFIATLEQTFLLGRGAIGIFGWLDTPVPTAVFFVWSAFIGALALMAFVLLRGRRFAFAATLAGTVLLLPPLIQGAYIAGGGFVWQGRYTLPLLVCLIVGVAAVLADRLELDRGSLERLSASAAALWAGAHWYSFMTALKRYGVGADGTWVELLLRPEWVPPGGVVLWAGISLVGAAAVAAGAHLLATVGLSPTAVVVGERPSVRAARG